MHTRSDPAQTRYRTLYRLGYWCSLEAECRTEASAEFSELIDHQVTFVAASPLTKPAACQISPVIG